MVNVRLATTKDREPAIALVRNLLVELGGNPPSGDAMSPLFERFAVDGGPGFVVVGDADGSMVAVCTVSFVDALRSAGRYAIIQEMFVEPDWRSAGVGMDVLCFALDHATAQGCRMVELGTPCHGDRQIQFYQRAGFTNVGARLRWRP